MPKPIVVVLLFALSAVVALAQVAPDKLYIDEISGKTNPEAIPDVDAQLIWLLAAAPVVPMASPSERGQMMDRLGATFVLQLTAFPSVKLSANGHLVETLDGFRSSYDSLVSEFNNRIASVPPNDVWKEYRDLRVKINDLVANTIRILNNTFPEDAAALRSEIQRAKGGTSFSSYKSLSDPNYDSDRRNAATGFGYIVGALSISAVEHGKNVAWITTVIVGMIPGCPGKPYATVSVDGSVTEGPQVSPVEYVYFLHTDKANSVSPSYSNSVQCAVPHP
jgi:hypothetical protein